MIPRRLRKFLIPISLVILGLIIASFFVRTKTTTAPTSSNERVLSVEVVYAELTSIQPKIISYGEVLSAREADLRALVEGPITWLHPDFRTGARVQAGQKLVEIEPTDYENHLSERKADLLRAEAQLKEFSQDLQWERKLAENATLQFGLAERSFERNAILAESGKISKKSLDDAKAALVRQEESLLHREQQQARLKAKIEQQKAIIAKQRAVVATSTRQLQKTVIYAPFSGYVSDVRLALGELLGKGDSVGRLLSDTELEVRFEIPDEEYGRLANSKTKGENNGLMGRTVEALWALGADKKSFLARVSRVAPEINPTVGGVAIYATFDQDTELSRLRKGAFVQVSLDDITFSDVQRIPSRAVAPEGSVYVIRKGRLEAVPVEIVRVVGDESLVRGRFIQGESIVAYAFSGIGPGVRARAL